VSRAAAEMGSAPTAAETRSPTTAAEMGSAAAPKVGSAAPTTADVSAAAPTPAGPARGHQIDRTQSHDRRQKDCTNSNSTICHDYLLSIVLRIAPEKAKSH